MYACAAVEQGKVYALVKRWPTDARTGSPGALRGLGAGGMLDIGDMGDRKVCMLDESQLAFKLELEGILVKSRRGPNSKP